MHQFVPVPFVDPQGNKLADMYIFVVGQRLDTVDRAHSNYILRGNNRWVTAREWKRLSPDDLPPDADLESPPKMVFSLSQIGDACIWRDMYIPINIYMSDAFFDAFHAEGLTGLGGMQVEVVR